MTISDPLVPLKFIVNSPITSVVDTVFKATFICLLLLFWVSVYHGMQQVRPPGIVLLLLSDMLVKKEMSLIPSTEDLDRVSHLDHDHYLAHVSSH